MVRRPWFDPIHDPSGITVAQPDLLEPLAQHRVGRAVGQHDEALGAEHLGRPQRLDRVGQQVAGVGGDLELDPVGQLGGAGQAGQADGLVGVDRAAGVRQQHGRGRCRWRRGCPRRRWGRPGAARRSRARSPRPRWRRAARRSRGTCRCRGTAATGRSSRRSPTCLASSAPSFALPNRFGGSRAACSPLSPVHRAPLRVVQGSRVPGRAAFHAGAVVRHLTAN